MKMKFLKSSLVSVTLLLGIAPSAFAGTGDFALGVKGGTLGIGAEVTFGLLPSLNLRSGYNAFNYDGSATKNSIDYSYKLKLGSLPVLVDWHPFPASDFRLSTGLVFNSNKVEATGKAQGTYTIDGQTYNASQIGTLTGKIDFNSTAPYLGIGWGNAVAKGSPLSLSCDVGVLFQGTPKVTLTPSVTPTTAIQTSIANEEASIRDTTDNFKYYPVVSLGLAYKF
jgi:hypothetical protein